MALSRARSRPPARQRNVRAFTSVSTDGARMTADCATLTRSLAANTRMTRSTTVRPLAGRRMRSETRGWSRRMSISWRRTVERPTPSSSASWAILFASAA